MGTEATKTEGGTYIRVDTDKRGTDHIDVYDSNPKGPHDESIHISIGADGKGRITTKSGNNPKETTDTQCYLTTACMRHKMEKFDDNCEELTILRWFRDRFVSKTDIEHYYEAAPIIVKKINDVENNNEIYNYIYDNVVSACVTAIKHGEFEFAYNRYKNSILILEEQFINSKNNIKVKKLEYSH